MITREKIAKLRSDAQRDGFLDLTIADAMLLLDAADEALRLRIRLDEALRGLVRR